MKLSTFCKYFRGAPDAIFWDYEVRKHLYPRQGYITEGVPYNRGVVRVHPWDHYLSTIVWYAFGSTNNYAITQLGKVQRLAQRLTSPKCALRYYSHLLPTNTRLDRKVTLPAARLLTLPSTPSNLSPAELLLDWLKGTVLIYTVYSTLIPPLNFLVT